MALANWQYHTEDLTYWPQLRHFSSFLKEIDRFYLFNEGRGLLFITHDDRVYFSECIEGSNLEESDKWSYVEEVVGLSGRRVVMVLSKSFIIYALTRDGLLLEIDVQDWWTEPIILHTSTAFIAGDFGPYALSHDGTVFRYDYLNSEMLLVEELVDHGQVFAIDCCWNQVAALTSTGKCLILDPVYTDDLTAVVQFQVLQIPPLPTMPVAINFSITFSILTSDGKIYQFPAFDNLVRPNGVIHSRPTVISLDQPIRRIYDFTTFENIKGQLYEFSYARSIVSTPSAFTSYADYHTIIKREGMPLSPGLTQINAFDSTELFNDPQNCDLQIMDHLFVNETRPKLLFYVSRDVLYQALPSLREQLDQSNNQLTYHYSVRRSLDTLLPYFRYLHNRNVNSFEQCAFGIYIQAHFFEDQATQHLLVGVISRQLSRLYQLSPFDFRVYLESNLRHNPNTFEWNFLVDFERARIPESLRITTRTRPDSTLRERLIRYVLWNPNQVYTSRRPQYLFLPPVQ